jgi:hypothetical protein
VSAGSRATQRLAVARRDVPSVLLDVTNYLQVASRSCSTKRLVVGRGNIPSVLMDIAH